MSRCVVFLFLLATMSRVVWAGTLEVDLQNFHGKAGRHAVVARPHEGTATHVEEPTSSGKCVIRDLPPGKYLVEVLILSPEQYLAKHTVTVAATGTTRATIKLDDALDPALRVPLGGTIEVPAEWGKVNFRIEIDTLQVPSWSDDHGRGLEVSPRDGRWSCGPVVPGVYRIQVHPLTYQVVANVGNKGVSDLKIVVPPPVDVTARAVDADSGADVALPQLEWHARWARSDSYGKLDGPMPGDGSYWGGSGSFHVVVRGVDGTYRFRAPAGALVVEPPLGSGFYRDETEYDIAPGRTELKVLLRRECGLLVKLKPQIKTDLWAPLSDLQVEGNGELRAITRDGVGLYRLFLSRPGKYRVHGERYGIPQQEVTVPAGAFAEVKTRE